jgi:Flp pilus assembly pilin Flp
MTSLAAFFTIAREFHRKLSRGQTMTEYSLILAAIAIVCFVAYETTGQDITGLIVWGQVGNDLTSAL